MRNPRSKVRLRLGQRLLGGRRPLLRAAWRGAVLSLMLLLASPAVARAEVRATVDVGWSGRFRAGRWTPLFVTATDTSRHRQAILDIYAPTDRRHAVKIHQSLPIGPTPVTVPLYVPLSNQLEQSTVGIVDANGGRTLYHQVVGDQPAWINRDVSVGPVAVEPDDLFIGLSGSSGSQRLLEGHFDPQSVSVGYLPPNRLPAVPAGYDAIDVLMLNQPDLNRIDAEQQRSIVAWVRGGGVLVLWPGAEPLPATGPIVEVLPCAYGENTTYDLPPKAVETMGLPARFGRLKGRRVTNVATDAKPVALFGDGVEPLGYRRWVGFGQVVALPADVSTLVFNSGSGGGPGDRRGGTAFWRQALRGVIEVAESRDDESGRGYYDQTEDARRVRAQRQALDWLSDVPGAGSFGFSYLAAVLLALMLVVGPVDWFVLKWLGRQPWTWVTTSGWIAVVTLAAISVGRVLRSGDVHFRTFTVLDQAGGARVAAVDLAGIYSPQTGRYDVGFDAETWWRPVADTNRYGGNAMLTEIDCHQDYHGSRPLPMTINVWNLRFLRGVDYAQAAPLLAAKLTREEGGAGGATTRPAGGNRTRGSVRGTITNQSEVALEDVVVRTRGGILRVGQRIEPGATVQVSGELDTRDRSFASTRPTGLTRYQVAYGDVASTTRPSVSTAGDLAVSRTDRIEQMLRDRDDAACVYARFSGAAPERVKLNDEPKMMTAHEGVVRAVVTME